MLLTQQITKDNLIITFKIMIIMTGIIMMMMNDDDDNNINNKCSINNMIFILIMTVRVDIKLYGTSFQLFVNLWNDITAYEIGVNKENKIHLNNKNSNSINNKYISQLGD